MSSAMLLEIRLAQSFVLNFLYNKLPRRRVNLFGEELENALRDKFGDHWYPDMPCKGSAFRCLRITDPNDLVLQRAARLSGNSIDDLIENLPADLAIWIDPGEVSYRIGEKGAVKVLYSANNNNNNNNNGNGGEESVNQTANSGSVSSSSSASADDLSVEPLMVDGGLNTWSSSPSSSPSSTSSATLSCFPRNFQQPPVTYTAGTFAQTKFGSTKLKGSGNNNNNGNAKRNNNNQRVSPTEFSNYIRQRALLQKQTSMPNGFRHNNRPQQQFYPPPHHPPPQNLHPVYHSQYSSPGNFSGMLAREAPVYYERSFPPSSPSPPFGLNPADYFAELLTPDRNHVNSDDSAFLADLMTLGLSSANSKINNDNCDELGLDLHDRFGLANLLLDTDKADALN